MFTQLGPNSVQSSNGFKVERKSRIQIKYTEGERSVVIEVEPGDGLAIYVSSIAAWTTLAGNEPIGRGEVARIVDNLCQALEFLKIPYLLE
jgi:hypothetical protein